MSRLRARSPRRTLMNGLMSGVFYACAILAMAPLLWVLSYVISRGWPGLSLNFFTDLPRPIGEVGGGMGNAILGTTGLVGLAAAIGVPVGIAAGIFLSEYSRFRLASALRFAVELLAGVPSIVIGIFAYAVIVVPLKGFSWVAGSLALAVMMIPTVARTTEELLKLVPTHLREAGLALGLPRWRVTIQLILRGSLGGVATGVTLAVARAAGVTAPLLFTALSSQYWPRGLMQPIATIPVQLYTYAISPYESWHQLAWTAALVLVFFVMIANLGLRWIVRKM